MRYKYCTTIAMGMMLLFSSCRLETKEAPGTIVSVGDRFLTRQMLDAAMPDGLLPRDSSAFIDAYVRNWVENELVYDIAQKNVPDVERIEKLVDKYRQELFIHEYQKQLLNEKLDVDVSADAIKKYYRQNLDRFVLQTPIIKGLYLKVSEKSPDIKELRKWYRINNQTAVENIEKSSLHNIVNYDYFYDRWISFDEVMGAIPYSISDANRFLQNNKYLEVNKDGYWYLLNIDDYQPAGATMPLDFAKVQIEEILVAQKRSDFLRQMKKELYQEALENRKVKYFGRHY